MHSEDKGTQETAMGDIGPALILCQTRLLRGSQNQNVSNQYCGAGNDCYSGTKKNTETSRNCTVGLSCGLARTDLG